MPRVDTPGWLDLDELCRLVPAPPEWVTERVQAGLVEAHAAPADAGPAQWRFDTLVVGRMRSMRRTERCYDAAPELAALVADLEEEVARLRAQLFALGR
ncbi:MAG: MerR family transcriptional regulator [Rubrivivax sp.]|nr:MerR family transcriptional regulator [Rubrivivax sp.]